MILKETVKKIIFRKKSSSKSYVKYLKKLGMKIGDGTIIYDPIHTMIDLTRPWLIEIGENVKITYDVIILTHGFEWSVIKTKYNDVLGSAGKVKIGNNVFVGMRTTILKGVTIGDNVIIGANSLINKDIPSNVVVAGNPAKIVCSIEEYYEKRMEKQVYEAVELATEYYNVYNKWPNREVLREFLFLFDERTDKINNDIIFNEISSINGNYDETLSQFFNRKREFSSYHDFINYCKKKMKEGKK